MQSKAEWYVFSVMIMVQAKEHDKVFVSNLLIIHQIYTTELMTWTVNSKISLILSN